METAFTSPKMKKINTPFGYFGSKNRIAQKLCEDLPPHTCWVEAFCGSAALTLCKEPAEIEVINDKDSEIYNFFRQLRRDPEALIRAVEWTPYAEEELKKARIPEKGLDDLERARRFLVRSMLSINSVFGKGSGFSYTDSFSRNGQDARVHRWNKMPERLEAVVARLKNVRIENKDALKIMKRYLNRPNTLLYLDPPYLGDRTSGYDNDVNNADFHARMLHLANQAECMIFISTYEHELYDELLAGWRKRTIRTSTRGTDGKTLKRTEVVWMNKAYVDAYEKQQMPLLFTEKEKIQGRCNPEKRIGKEEQGVQLSLDGAFEKHAALGRFELFKRGKSYYFRLLAPNDLVLLESHAYTGKRPCLVGIESVRAIALYLQHYDQQDHERYTFTLRSASGEVIGHSPEYASRKARDKAIEAVRKNAPNAALQDLVKKPAVKASSTKNIPTLTAKSPAAKREKKQSRTK